MAGSIRRNVAENLRVKTADIDADAVDGTKIADDSIDSEHVVALSLDEEHYADNSVATDKLSGVKTGTASMGALPSIAVLKTASTTVAIASALTSDDFIVSLRGAALGNLPISIVGAACTTDGQVTVYMLNTSSGGAIAEGSGAAIGTQALTWVRMLA